MNVRKQTKKVRIGNRFIGGNEPVLIQSMTNTYTQNIKETTAQIHRLEEAGCEMIRVAVPDMEAAAAISAIKKQIKIPIAADIHFDYRLAIESIKNGADKIRINPGNIGGEDRLRQVIDAAKAYEIPIRIGVNSGSLEKELLAKYGRPTAAALVESAMNHVKMVEAMDFQNIVIALKSSDVPLTIQSYMTLSEQTDYPLHLGITEAGTKFAGTIKSSVGIGTLLAMGIGDTIRVSLTGDPIEEIYVAKEILKSLKLMQEGVEIISCPTCGRCNVDLAQAAEAIEKELGGLTTQKPLKVAVMGCAVNGPGEAREADIGIAGGKGEFLLFVKGEIVKKIPQDNVVEELVHYIKETFCYID